MSTPRTERGRLAVIGLTAALLLAAGLAAGCGPRRPAPPAPADRARAGGPAAATPTTHRPASRSAPLPRSRPLRLTIPAIRVDAPLVPLGLQPDGSMQVPADFAVAGWYVHAPTPGELGPAVLTGHVDSHAGPAVFYRLATLRPGDRVTVSRQDGRVAAFTVDRIARYAKARFPTAEVYGDLPYPGLRLITCGGSFDPGTGHYRDNVVVFASLHQPR